jgi:Na+-transporting NADH:ubiquinone oxidoreductase subunit C
MNKNIKMLLFVLFLGTFTSVLLLLMGLITDERIENNQAALIKSAILDGFDIEYNFANINDVFDDEVTIYEDGDAIIYEDPSTGYVSFQFEGGGVWGPIIGILTLEDDWETIVEITILEQEETPGLGGVVAERNYLDNYVGKEMEIDILKGATTLSSNQVDSITGATRTSDAFETILNTNYQSYLAIWESLNE